MAIILCCTLAGKASAQLSPGDLSDPHAHLEGLRNCSTCHRLGDRDVVPKCLECHTRIAARRAAGKGLHAGPGFEVCTDCHMEHQGRGADLVIWPDGIAGFDHGRTGYALQGRHRKLECRVCHRADRVTDPVPLRAAGKDLDRTYLGLSTVCAACHTDVHRAQLSGDCAACHGLDAWTPASGFDHQATVYPLTGRHLETACAKCHPALDPVNPLKGALRFKGIAHAGCIDCHRDPHVGRLGAGCTDCHSPDGWRNARTAAFDHDRSRYPLRGRHRTVACEKCHKPRQALATFAACTDCHPDVHGAAAASRPRLARCEDCHDVEGFKPAHYPLDRHLTGAYPLAGAHLATACDACHRREQATGSVFDLVLDHAACTDCHRDPHGHTAGPEPRVCTGCHEIGSWRRIAFDHASLGYPLAGAHARVACRDCHPAATGTIDPAATPVFAATTRICVGCHTDIHLGQFAVEGEPSIDCERCHVTLDWYAERFDHDRNSRFTLRGGHEGVACEACHKPLEAPGGRSRIFKPLATGCIACHRAVPARTGAER